MESSALKHTLQATVGAISALAFGTSVFAISLSIGMQVKNADLVVLWICWSMPALILVGITLAIWKRIPYVVALPVLGISIVFLGYMRSDDKALPAPPDIASQVVPDSASLAAFQRLPRRLKGEPVGAVHEQVGLPEFPTIQEGWPAFVTENRAVLELAWSQDADQQAVFDELAAHEPVGLYSPVLLEEPSLDNRVIRRSAALRWSRAHIYIIDGKPDDAVRLLLPFLYGNYHLQFSSPDLIDQMIANVIIKNTYRALNAVLDAPGASASVRRDLLTALNASTPIKRVLDNAFLGEELFGREALSSINKYESVLAGQLENVKSRFGGSRSAAALQSPVLQYLLFNPNKTQREHSAHLREWWSLMAARQLEKLDERMLAASGFNEPIRLKNSVGELLSRLTWPDIKKISRSWWECEDIRLALIKRLEENP